MKLFTDILIKWFFECESLDLKMKVNEECLRPRATVQFNSVQKLIQKSYNS